MTRSLVLLVALSVGGALPVSGQEPTGAPTGPTGGTVIRGADLSLLVAVRRVSAHVEKLRGESFSRPPMAINAPGPIREIAAEIRAHVVLTRERLEARGRAWADLGLGGERSPAVLFEMLAADLEGIGYEPGANRLLVGIDRLDSAPERSEQASTLLMMTGVEPDEALAAHLLMHVRQHERRGGDSLAETTDRTLARSAWAEGEANLVAIRYLFAGMGLADDVMLFGLDPRDVLGGSLFPVALDGVGGIEGELVRWVYLDGYDEAVRRYRVGGFAALDQALRRDQTTRDLLHPQENPAPPASFVAPEPPGGDSRWVLADEDSLGEQAILALLAEWTGKDNLALLAAEGWAGDRVYRWEGAGGETTGVTVWVTRWVSEQDAADFDYSLGRALGRRFPDRPLASAAPGARVLEGGERVFRLERNATEVRLRVLTPDWDARLNHTEAVAPKADP